MADRDFVYSKDLQLCNYDPTYDLEWSIRNCLALAGLHDTDFLTTLDEDFEHEASGYDSEQNALVMPLANKTAQNMGQSFTVDDPIELLYVYVTNEIGGGADPNANQFTVRLGQDMSGSIVATGTSLIVVGGGGGGEELFRISFAGGIALVPGLTYTIAYAHDAAKTFRWILGDVYASGQAYHTGAWQAGDDFAFDVTGYALGVPTGWGTYSEGGWYNDRSFDYLWGIGSGSSRWYRLLCDTDVSPSFVCEFDKYDNRGSFCFCGDGSTCYCVWWDSTRAGVGKIDASGALTEITTNYCDITGDARMRVAVKQLSLSDPDEIDFLSATLYANERAVAYGCAYIAGETLGDYIGFGVYDSDSIMFDNLIVAELHRIVPWTSVDPGEPVMAGLSRAIGTTPVYYFSRYDGTVRCWIPGDRTVDWAIPTTRDLTRATQKTKFVPAHARMVGSYHEVDNWNDTVAEHQARPTFSMLQDPNLESQSDIEDGVIDGHRRLRENALRYNDEVPGSPLIEPQDRVTVNSEDVRVTSVLFVVKKDGPKKAPSIRMHIEGTDYIAEGS